MPDSALVGVTRGYNWKAREIMWNPVWLQPFFYLRESPPRSHRRGGAHYTFLSTCDHLNFGVSIQVRQLNQRWSLWKKRREVISAPVHALYRAGAFAHVPLSSPTELLLNFGVTPERKCCWGILFFLLCSEVTVRWFRQRSAVDVNN